MTLEASISANGSATVMQRPQILLMQVQLVESAQTIADAISQLKARTVRARQMLEKHEPTVIEFGDAVLGKPELNSQNMVARKLSEQHRRRRSGRRQAAADSVSDVSPIVRKYLRAHWPLRFDSEEGSLTFVYRLQRDLATIAGAGVANPPEDASPHWPSPEEEMQAMMASAIPEEPDVRIPEYFYVSQLSDEEYNEALTEAFAAAPTSAGVLAAAAGKQRGELQSISESLIPDEGSHYALHMRQHLANSEWLKLKGGKKEVVWDSLTQIRFVVSVTTRYALV